MNTVVKSCFRGKAQAGFNFGEMVIDNFAGGGGASTGIEAAIGRPVDVAINHDLDAVRMHEVNHPHTQHYCESVWDVNPREITKGRPVGLVWLSPDCTHFSKARGSVPVKKEIRGLAWVALRWASLPMPSKPRLIMLENVEEFMTWGPVRTDADGNCYPCPKRKGQTFQAFIAALERWGYRVEYRVLRASDYGTPTIRKRFFLVARCDGQPIVWPEPTHGPGRLPYRTAAECIDWSLPCPSIFLTQKEGKAIRVRRPLADATLRRIAAGVMRYVINSPEPFIVNTRNGERDGQKPRVRGISEPMWMVTAQGSQHALVVSALAPLIIGSGGPVYAVKPQTASKPLGTVTKENHRAVVSAFLAKHYTGVVGDDLRNPLPTVTARDHNAVVTAHLQPHGNHDAVRAFLIKYYGNETGGVPLTEPMHTVTANDRLGLVMVRGEPYAIVDIGMRMLTPAELYRAQGFPADYVIDRDIEGTAFSKGQQVARCGNSVCPPLAEALVRANWEPVQQQVAA